MCEMMQRTHSMLEHQTAVLAICERSILSSWQVCDWMDSKSIQCEALCRRKPLCECRGQRMAGPRRTTDARTNEYGLFLHSPECGERVVHGCKRTVGSVCDPLPRPCRDRVYGMSQSNWAPTHGLRHTGEIRRRLEQTERDPMEHAEPLQVCER